MWLISTSAPRPAAAAAAAVPALDTRRRSAGQTSPTSPSTSTARTGPSGSTPTWSTTAWWVPSSAARALLTAACCRYSTCVTRTAAGSPTCAPTRPASTRSSACATGTTTWTAPPRPTGEPCRRAGRSCVMSALMTRYYLNDLTYRTDPPKTTTESYNVRRRKSKWSEKEPRRTEAEAAEAELSLAHLGYWPLTSCSGLSIELSSLVTQHTRYHPPYNYNFQCL